MKQEPVDPELLPAFQHHPNNYLETLEELDEHRRSDWAFRR